MAKETPRGHGGGYRWPAAGANRLTANQGTAIADNWNSVRAGELGPRVYDAFAHFKITGHVIAAKPLFAKVSVDVAAGAGMISLDAGGAADQYIAAAGKHRIRDRGPCVSIPG